MRFHYLIKNISIKLAVALSALLIIVTSVAKEIPPAQTSQKSAQTVSNNKEQKKSAALKSIIQAIPQEAATTMPAVDESNPILGSSSPVNSGNVVGLFAEYPKINYGSGDQAEIIKRGEYLVKVGDCIACHTDTTHQGAAFAGGLEMKTPFGKFYTPNITPDMETGIGKWNENDFIRAMQQGKNPQGHNYFPVFPYIYFAKTSKDDLRAIFAYLKSIPPVKKVNKKLPFPFNVPGSRFALYGWNLLFFYPTQDEYQYDSSRSAQWNRGAYLVQGLGHCGMCHTPMNPLGAPKTKYFLTGAFIDNYWAPNITGFGLKSASHNQVAEVFVSGQLLNQAGPVAGPMSEVNHNSLQYLTAEDRLAIVYYLKSVVSRQPLGIAPSENLPTLKRGKLVYYKACNVCHKRGQVGAPVIGDGSNWYLRAKQVGLNTLYRHAINGYNSMPIRGGCVTCSDNDIISAVDFLLAASLNHSQKDEIQKGSLQHVAINGKQIYEENCSTCHAEGKLGAPKLSDTAAWEPFLSQDFDIVINEVLNGQNHPKNGGCKYCSNTEVIAAIKYMFKQINPKGNYSLW